MKKLLSLLLVTVLSITILGCTEASVPLIVGDGEVTIEVGTTYSDLGLTSMDGVTTSGTVDTTTLGTYTITYHYELSDGTTGDITRTVHVVDTTLPTITLIGSGVITVTVGDPYIEPNAEASDNYDGDISSAIVITGTVDVDTPGDYTIRYNVSDSSGNAATEVTRTVTVEPILSAPTISLNGDAYVVIEQDSVYVDAGATASDLEDGDISSSIIETGTVDTSTIGTYTIEYNVTDSDLLAATTVTRTVEVVAAVINVPVISLVGADSVTIVEGDPYIDAGATASDIEDGDLTSSIVVVNPVNIGTPGTYTITYNVTDSDANAAVQVTRTVIVEAYVNEAPTLTLVGDEVISILVNSTFTDPGAEALDVEDGDLTSNITVTGSVDTTTIGTYELTYDISDSDGVTAPRITRTVIVTEALPDIYTRIYIQKDLVLDLPTILAELGYTASAIPAIDYSMPNTYSIDIGDRSIEVIIFDINDSTIVFQPGSLIKMDGTNYNSNYRYLLSVPIDQKVAISIDGIPQTNFKIVTRDYSTIFNLSSINGTSTGDFTIQDGLYNIFIDVKKYETEVVTIRMNIDEVYFVPTDVTLDINDYEYIYNQELIQNYYFDVETAGDFELNFSSLSSCRITIYDSLDNVIISQGTNNYQSFYLNQHFARGLYKIEIQFFNQSNPVSFLIEDTVVHDNFGPYLAQGIDIDTDVSIEVLLDRGWYTFNVTESGLYEFSFPNSEVEYLDFYVYDYNLNYIAYAEKTVYLEAGKHYMNFPYSYGQLTVHIAKHTGTITSNNDMTSATELSNFGTYDMFFDGNYTEKWYSLEITTPMTVHIGSRPSTYGYSITYSLIGTTYLYSDVYSIDTYLEVGTYYIKIQGRTGLSSSFYYIEAPSHFIHDPLTPIDLTIGETYRYYHHEGETHYFDLEITETIITQFNIFGSYSRMIQITKDTDIIFDGSKSSNDSDVFRFTPGTYHIEIISEDLSDVYEFSFIDITDTLSGFGTTLETAPFLNLNKYQAAYVEAGGELVYQKIAITQDSLLTGYYTNCEYITVYDSLGVFIKEGYYYEILPSVFETGEYILELTSSEKGLVSVGEIGFISIYDYGNSITLATLQEGYPESFSGYNPDLDAFDVIQINVIDEGLYEFDSSSTFFILLDSEYTYLTLENELSTIQYLSSGTYYIIINNFEPYYQVNIQEVTSLQTGNTALEAQEVYIETYNTVFLNNALETSFVSFSIDKPSYLDFSINVDLDSGQLVYQIYNSDMTYHDGLFFEVGTYYIKIDHQDSECSSICRKEKANIYIYDISGTVRDNTMLTANPIMNAITYYGLVDNPSAEAWFTFTLNQESACKFTMYGGGDYKLYNSSGVLLTDYFGFVQFLDTGTYYIQYTGDVGSYEFSLSFETYVEVSSDIDFAKNVSVGDRVTIESYIKDGSDVDWYEISFSQHTLFIAYYSGVDLELYDSDGYFIRTMFNMSYIEVDSGTYYVKVEASVPRTYQILIVDRTYYLGSQTIANAPSVQINDYTYGYKATTDVNYFEFYIPYEMTIEVTGTSYYTIYDILEAEVTDYHLLPGTYYIMIDTVNGLYSFSIDEIIVEVPIYSPSTAVAPEIISKIDFEIGYNAIDEFDEDFFEFTLTQDTMYEIHTGYEDFRLTIYDGTGTQILSKYDFSYKLIYLPADTYTIKISEVESEYYEFDFESKPYMDYSDDLNNPDEIGLYHYVKSYFTDSGERDYFTFTLTEATLIAFNCNVEYYVYSNSNYTGYLFSDYDFYVQYLEAGTYYLRTENNVSGEKAYNLNLWNCYDYHYATTLLEAMPIVIEDDLLTYKALYNGTDYTYMKIILTEDSHLYIDCNYTYTLVDELETPVTSELIPAGTYYLRLEYTSARIVEVNIKRVTDYIYDSSSNTAIVLGEIVHGFNFSSGDIDTFTFTPDESIYVYTDAIGKRARIIIYDSSMTEIYNYYTDDNVVVLLNASETYTIQILNVVEDYYFVLHEENH